VRFFLLFLLPFDEKIDAVVQTGALCRLASARDNASVEHCARHATAR
jgi:hypothetical protein